MRTTLYRYENIYQLRLCCSDAFCFKRVLRSHTLDSILSAPSSSQPCCLKNCLARPLPPIAMI